MVRINGSLSHCYIHQSQRNSRIFLELNSARTRIMVQLCLRFTRTCWTIWNDLVAQIQGQLLKGGKILNRHRSPNCARGTYVWQLFLLIFLDYFMQWKRDLKPVEVFFEMLEIKKEQEGNISKAICLNCFFLFDSMFSHLYRTQQKDKVRHWFIKVVIWVL